ncbi:MAG: hypothetical protein BMS9Abin05_0861 [Rhodothermia bacterium]|nr:MAG: hypothetical protein BMS9Abin05_0861 [Rhodothermia bacterium]
METALSTPDGAIHFLQLIKPIDPNQPFPPTFLRPCIIVLISAWLLLVATSVAVHAQVTSSDWAWKEITTVDGVEFFYIYYSEVRQENNGVVLKLVNWNDYPVRYRFRIVFKADGDVHDDLVTGTIGPETLVTGDDAGLFFLPFEDGRSIGEIGIKGYRIQRVEESQDGSLEESPVETELGIRYIF